MLHNSGVFLKGKKMKQSFVIIGSMLLALVLGGCASTTIKDMNTYQKVPLHAAEILPSKDALAGEKAKVVVLELIDNKGSAAGELVADAISNELNSTKNVEVVDRELAGRLGKEIELAQAKGRTGYKGQRIADFAITGKITSAGAGKSFTEASSWQDKKGRWHSVAAHCTTNGKIAFSIKVSELPSMNVINTFESEAVVSSTADSEYWRGCRDVSNAEARGIIAAAAELAVRKLKQDLKNQFASVGYVLERLSFEDKNIFKVTIGKFSGAEKDAKVRVMRVTNEINPLTGKKQIERVKVAEGLFTDQIGDKYSFVFVEDPTFAERIKLGDVVMVEYEESFSDMINKIAH